MNTLVYTLDDSAESAPAYWLGIFLAAVVVHILPLYYMSFHRYEAESDDMVVAVSLDDSFLDFDPAQSSTDPSKTNASAAKLSSQPDSPKSPNPANAQSATEPAAAAETVELPRNIPTAALAPAIQQPELLPPPPPEPPKELAAKTPPKDPAANKTKPPEKVAGAKDQHTKAKVLNEIVLPELMNSKNETGFDESQVTTIKPPENGLLSDRNSTAADKGPKNLKLGDPYIDKGDTNIVRYLSKRGEGNTDPVASDANSGSVKKEGTLVEGDGGGPTAKDFSQDVKIVAESKKSAADLAAEKDATAAQARRAVPPTLPPIEQKPEPSREAVSVMIQPSKTQPAVKPSQPKPPEADPETTQVGARLATPGKGTAKLEPPPTPLPVDPLKPLVDAAPSPAAPKLVVPKPVVETTDFRHPDGALVNVKRDVPGQPAALNATARNTGARKDPNEELEAFASQLNNVSSSIASGDGSSGSGAKLRKGEKGHEGNGSMRPGDSNAVSDVTTVNLESSAAEFGDPRFEKKFDAKTAYIKALARRIDNKWKADIAARLRARIVPGMVSIKIILRKDGKLLEATEAYRNRGMPDECVATAKHAVEEAADPSADPFPPALGERETIEYTFKFVYQ